MGFARFGHLAAAAGALVAVALLLVLSAALAGGFAGPRLEPPSDAKALLGLTPVPPPAASYPAGWWQRYTNAADGYSLALPPDWVVVSLDPEALAQDAGPPAGDAEPVAGRLAEWARERLKAGLGLWAATAGDGTLGDVTTVNIIRQPLEREMRIEDFARANTASLRQQGNKPLQMQQQWLDLVEGRALRTQMVYQLADPDGDTRSVHVTQVYLVKGQNGYVMTAVTRAEQAQEYAPTFDGIVRSLRWTA